MPILTPSGKQFSLHKLMAMSTMLSPSHNAHFKPLVQAGGGEVAESPQHQLYLSHDTQEHLRRVYDGLRDGEEYLSRVRFDAWLTAVQNHSIPDLDKDEYKFEQFLEAVYYSWGFEVTKPPKRDEKDTTKPISNYYISSSHNTYLMGNQLSSKSSTEAYKNVLIRGCRCIEIDVHNGEPLESKTPEIGSPPKNDHKRHISGSTLSSKAAHALERAEEKYDSTKQKIKEKTGLGKENPAAEERGRALTTDLLTAEQSEERSASVRSARSGEPLVLHGWTLTAPVGFRAVCKSIRETAFLTSNLPIIISLEVHADRDQQELMVSIMKEEWAGLLVEEPHETCNPVDRVPRLEELLNKILIKVKRAAASKQDTSSSGATLSPMPTRNAGDSGQSGSEDEKSSTKKKVKICEALSDLGIYTHSEHFSSFEAKSATSPSHIYSIGEKQILELHETKNTEMFGHNRDYFMRAYPAGFRIDSSNLDPSVFWRKGVQMVALNWQKLDEGMMLNEGMFAGEHGWVLKPPGYRSDPSEPIQFKTLDLKITVYAGQHIPLPPEQSSSGFHPYVKCELHVEKQDEDAIEGGSRAKEGEYKQRTPYMKGDHPDFGHEGIVLSFPAIPKVVEQLSFVRFKVADAKYGKDDLAAWACIRLDRIQQGYRFIHLFDTKGQATAGMLMVKIEKELK
ncbi:Phosphoinositide phospholipase C [Venustampulla echinocandica]|uniref:Phosphoinositide phospholipase C n=1 Tax=Venustampulla echinocandica TaxID=2656787 RepID=A0A370U108_9HELO|nr:Phosphoinositide phospholipase C [Venustampulla echinocandica]RDL41470.1 Phosphoinositide phospholipase C [Venustampulla echinocandica]